MRNSIVAICIIVKLGASWNYSHSQNSNGWDGGGEESRAGAVLITASPQRRLPRTLKTEYYCVGIGIPIITAYSRYKTNYWWPLFRRMMM